MLCVALKRQSPGPPGCETQVGRREHTACRPCPSAASMGWPVPLAVYASTCWTPAWSVEHLWRPQGAFFTSRRSLLGKLLLI